MAKGEVIRIRDEFYIRSSSARVEVRTRVLKQGQTFAVFDRFGFGRESVVLRRNGDFARFDVLHRLIPAAVPELQLEGGSAEGVSDDLVAEADSEDRKFLEQSRDRLVNVGQGRRIAGSVR